MRFSLNHRRVVIGHSLSIKVTATGDETIARVVTRLDSSRVGDDRLDPNEVQYERVFEQTGGAGPGREHVLVVTATNADGRSQTASLRWQDTV